MMMKLKWEVVFFIIQNKIYIFSSSSQSSSRVFEFVFEFEFFFFGFAEIRNHELMNYFLILLEGGKSFIQNLL
jgi:hypothetical protein